MKEMFLTFIKQFGIMLLFIVLVITCVGSISTKDTAFVLTGIVSLVALAVATYKFIRKYSGNKSFNK